MHWEAARCPFSLLAWPGARLRAPSRRTATPAKQRRARSERRSPRRRSPGWATPVPEQGAAPPAGPGRAGLRSGGREERGQSRRSLHGAASSWRAATRGGAYPDGPRRAGAPGPSPAPSAARSAPLRAALPYRALPGALRRGSGAPPAPPAAHHTPAAGTRRRKNCGQRRTGAGEVAPSQGPRPEGRRGGGCHRPSCTASRVLRPRGIAGAAAATERRDAHVGPAPGSPTVSRRRPAAQGPTARCGARQHAALAGLRAAAERRAQRRLRRGEYAGAAPQGCAIGCTRGTLSPGYAERGGNGTGRDGEPAWGGAGPPLSG